MLQTDLILTPEEAFYEEIFLKKAANSLNVDIKDITDFKIERKSIDARKKNILINLRLAIFLKGEKPEDISMKYHYGDVSKKQPVVVVGFGPAGLFAALRLIELGFKPIVLERGKNVHDRKRDIAILNTKQILNEDSNYCFGEGGAGTFSDGKLYTRSNKRGDISRILEIFNIHGADNNILYESRPHIGTDKLPKIISNIRERILNSGGEIHFSCKMTDLITCDNKIKAVVTSDKKEIETKAVILATGHSAEDVYKLLEKKGVKLQSKGFAMGVRVEHPRQMIDEIFYHHSDTEYLPAATYSLVTQIQDRGVYSFCMCPGGQIVPSATQKGYNLVNGMSAAARRNYWSNAGIVVEIRPEDIPGFSQETPLCGLEYQKEIERLTFINGGSTQKAPAQRLTDFIKGRISGSLMETSYVPGVVSSPVHFWLPDFISTRLREGFKDFDKKMKGFVSEEAMILATESRTSSPIRIVRDENKLNCPMLENLFPCGEGAGYAGGIVSSAMDGEKAAESVATFFDF